MSNIYYNPETFGLEIIEALDRPDQDYSFDMFAIWRRKEDGALFYAQDSGCSCPSPFQDLGVQDLMELKDITSFQQELTSWATFLDAQEIQAIVDKIHVILVYNCTIL